MVPKMRFHTTDSANPKSQPIDIAKVCFTHYAHYKQCFRTLALRRFQTKHPQQCAEMNLARTERLHLWFSLNIT